MRKQLYIDSRRGQAQADGALLFVLPEAITTPSPDYNFDVQLVDLRIPLTNWAIHEKNNVLHLQSVGVDSGLVMGDGFATTLPTGNWPVDKVVDHLNAFLASNWSVFRASYSENTNALTLSSVYPDSIIEVGPQTTCSALLGLAVGARSVGLGAPTLTGTGVDLSGTSCFYFLTSLRATGNVGNDGVFAKVPITGSPNAVQTFSSSGRVEVTDNTIDCIRVAVADDDMVPVAWHGGYWTATLVFETQEILPLKMQMDYRTYLQPATPWQGPEYRQGRQDAGPTQPAAPAADAQRPNGGPG